MELTMEQTRYDELALFLREMAARFRDTAFTDKRRLLSLLSDRMSDARREIKVVGAAVDERAFETLARVRPEQLAMEIERLAAKLQDNLGIRPDVAIPVVRACAYALSVGPLPSQSAAVAGSAWTNAGAPRPDRSWVGLSEAAFRSPDPSAMQQDQPTLAKDKRKQLLGAVAVAVMIAYGSNFFGSQRSAAPSPAPQTSAPAAPQPAPQPAAPMPQPAPQPPSQPAPQPAPSANPQPAPVPQPQPRQPAQQAAYFGEENRDFQVPPQSTLKSDVGNPTPLTIPGGTTVSTVQLGQAMLKKTRMVLVDALRSSHATTVPGAVALPYAGDYGAFDDQVEVRLGKALWRLTQGRPEIPVVFFCEGVRCWESYNAALRARAAGFTNVFWYRGGLNAWRAANLPMQPYH
jgi:PQQ-dependent catabolism-associated CXXCW motif protein